MRSPTRLRHLHCISTGFEAPRECVLRNCGGEYERTLPALGYAAVETLAGGDAGLLGALRSELSEVLAFLEQPEQEEACRVVHFLIW